MRDEDLHASELAHLPRWHASPGLLEPFDVGRLEAVDDLSERLEVGLAVAFLQREMASEEAGPSRAKNRTKASRMNLAMRATRSSGLLVRTICRPL